MQFSISRRNVWRRKQKKRKEKTEQFAFHLSSSFSKLSLFFFGLLCFCFLLTVGGAIALHLCPNLVFLLQGFSTLFLRLLRLLLLLLRTPPLIPLCFCLPSVLLVRLFCDLQISVGHGFASVSLSIQERFTSSLNLKNKVTKLNSFSSMFSTFLFYIRVYFTSALLSLGVSYFSVYFTIWCLNRSFFVLWLGFRLPIFQFRGLLYRFSWFRIYLQASLLRNLKSFLV